MDLVKIIAWCGLGYFGGLLFARKGYPPRVGVLVGIFLGPFALALCFLLPHTERGRMQALLERQTAEELALESQEKTCPKCKRTLAFTTKICPRCEHRFEVAIN